MIAYRTRQLPGVEGACVEQLTNLNAKGYARVKRNGRLVLAHRAAWERVNGPIPAGVNILHKCDNPPCISMEHLFAGTHAENMADMAMKGRQGPPLRVHSTGRRRRT